MQTRSLTETIEGALDDVRAYLSSPEGRQMRRRVATGLIVAAPLITRLPMFKRSMFGRVLALAGGAALIAKAGEWIRDWEPTGQTIST